ncbi:ATP-dependent 6-phosphofructokinase-like isoform X2 [Physella acuta]|nr:ATP-dependent 6-phosphofructokinase-like isoform X2 [Physella acuta]XP_059171904.1 ATP-dependent 6-phosphofructokinase-like isoform X2 [Physella acuta]XP_059171905.1 ATP-dependent 6-phosphofructokinase-like isoform X2 [Physella acuta]
MDSAKLSRHVSFDERSMTAVSSFIQGSLEGDTICQGKWTGQKIGVFTSGGDAQGMNAAVRAIVRVGMYLGCKVYYINEGYQGMVDGGEHIQEATWQSTSNIIHMGGTVIGSARCMEFKERWGRLKAAQNLIHWGITNLIAIGGDGSLTGADLFRQEWPSLVRELVDKEILTKDKLSQFGSINIVGLVGSIDNDFCGTDMTIGVDSALHRIQEAVDNIMTTAVSHKRAFVLEIMGRMCGFLPLAAGISSEATFIFIPEEPPLGDWRQLLCEQMMEKSKSGEVRRTHIILVAEGAIDSEGNQIKCTDVQKVLTDRMKMDVRVTVLGHVQRGGNASAFDRILATRMGAEAVLALLDTPPNSPASVICLDGNDIVRVPLMKAVEKTKLVGEKMAEKNFEEVVTLRGRPIVKNLAIYALQSKVITHPSLMPPRRKKIYRIAMLHVGSPACGMNAVARGFVSVCVSRGYEPVFVYNSWEGLSARKVKAVVWNDVHHWTSKGGSLLGTNTKTAQEIGLGNIADALNELDISGLVIVGGFEAYESACQIHHAREHYEELCVPVAVVPATIANNVPGAVMCIGCDTALNQICKACDDLKQSAFSIQKCVYIVEVGGDNCGYLATLAAIAAGADFAFIQEENFSVRDIQNLCHTIKHKFEYSGVEQALLIRNENANPNLTTDFIFRIFNEEGKPSCTARQTKLGHIQEGYKATPYDRAAGIRAGSRCTDWMINAIEANGGKDKDKIFTKSPTTVVVYCSRKEMAEHMPVDELMLQTDFEKRLPKRQWWTKLRGLMDILSWSNVITD